MGFVQFIVFIPKIPVGSNCSTSAPGFDIYFHRLATHVAVLVPSFPCTIVGLRTAGRHVLEQWWSLAKRHAFRKWQYLLNNQTGIFLVTKCVKTRRYAQCCSKGLPQEMSHLQIYGMNSIPRSNENVQLPVNGTTWQVSRNELGFSIHDSGGDAQFTIFIERDASRMFNLTDPAIRDAAQRLWT